MSSQNSSIPSELVGTWSTNNNITTGPSFVDPVHGNFTVPTTPGLSFSFTSDGYFEEAYYTINGNASYPQCVTSVLQWQHGSFNVTTNHTINTYPIEADGRMNLTNPCMSGGYWDGTAQYYYQPETYEGYTIDASGKLTLIRFDGQPLRPMTLISSDPIMWPMQLDAPKSSDGSFNSSFNVWLYLMFLVLSILYLLV
ncbi:chaperone for protein-folding within the ER, fungal-domain-containing protein [Umbelopsis sp. PMI_123]|nr:chaperone for protein-folding within the ER, fungal-domain-containing protein [Umbelopsis sp. PMI_123]